MQILPVALLHPLEVSASSSSVMTLSPHLVYGKSGVPLKGRYVGPVAETEAAHCQPGALTDSYGLKVQAVLALFAFTTLVFKRYLEPATTRRPWLIWFFDVSKQGFGAFVIHFLNVFLSDLLAEDPCTYYVVSYLLDCTFGLVFIWVWVKLLTVLARVNRRWETLRFGDYGSPSPSCRYWRHQCLAFVAVSVLEKLCVVVIIQFPFWRNVRRLILKPIEWLEMPRLEVTLVVLVVPLAMNTLIFWVVDNITKKQQLPTMGVAGSLGHNRSSSSSFRLPFFAKLLPTASNGATVAASSSEMLNGEAEKLLLDDEPPTPTRLDVVPSLVQRHNTTN